MAELQELCLREIVKSIDRFNLAYSTTDNVDLQRGFQVLQKFYSNRLVLKLGNKNLLQEKHADLIFNKYLTGLETKWLSNFSWKATLEIFKRIGPSLEKVCFRHDDPRDLPLEDAICHIPNAKQITCTFACTNSILRSIANCCPRLEKLDVSMSHGVTDIGLSYLCRKQKGKKRSREGERPAEKEKVLVPCPLLKEIDLSITPVEDRGIAELLKNVPSLERIECVNLPIILHKMHRADLGSLDTVQRYNLRYLDLFCCLFSMRTMDYFDEILEFCVTVCPNLETFSCPVSNLEHLDWCSKLPNVKDLELTCTENSAMDISDFFRQMVGRLTTLTLFNFTVSQAVREECRPFIHKLEIDGDTVKIIFRR